MKHLKIVCSIAMLLLAQLSNGQSKKFEISMLEDRWEFPNGTVEFITHQSVPAMKILPGAGKVVPREVDFATGTIEFDLELGDYPFVGFSFHRKSGSEEWFYFRPYAAGNPAAIDAIQYAPVVKGVTLWDMYPTYQGPANFQKGEWTHVKLVIGTHQMLAYVNETEQATLTIPYLEGDNKSGVISFDGEAIIANLVIQPGVTDGLEDMAGFDPAANDSRYIRNWSVTTPTLFPKGREVIASDLPGDEAEWKALSAERQGLVNLSREFGGTADGSRRLVWLKSDIHSTTAQTRKLSLGFSDEVWVMINGQLLYVDKNYYRAPIMKNPGGRCSLENTTFEVPLNKGDNELLIGVGNFFYGWGVIARWDTLDHLILK
jgi:hypothetical protein